MSASHADHAPGADHVPHVLPLRVYFGVFAMLIVFTGITVAVSYVDLGHAANLFIALLVASAKALMVASIFMHLAFDKKFNAVIAASALIFLVIFVTFTMYDTNWRGLGGRVLQDKPADVTNPFGVTKAEEEIRKKYGSPQDAAQ